MTLTADEVRARLRDLRGQIPSLLSLRCGQNAVDKPNSWDIALITEHADEDAGLGLLLHQIDQIALAGDADVEVAVGGQHHAVDASGQVVGHCHAVTQVQPGFSGG